MNTSLPVHLVSRAGSLSAFLLSVATAAALSAQNAPAGAAASGPSPVTTEAVQLSPFQVDGSQDQGYLAANALSGTRLNSKLEDLSASITVITKQQMLDMAALDINDLFKYEASTEGTATFTNFTVGQNGEVGDFVQRDPQASNRIRGLGAANISSNGFPQKTAIPIDLYNTEAVELSRGPNTSLFGLGGASGSVNILRSQANLKRSISSFTLRGDSHGGYRSSLDLNRPLFRDTLALRLSAVYDARRYLQKPSGETTRRQQATLTYQPFGKTTIRATYERLRSIARRPNSVTPRDAVTYWQSIGSPGWDPVTQTVTYADGRRGTSAVVDGFFNIGAGFTNSPTMYIDQGTVKLWTLNRLSTTANPNGFNSAIAARESGTLIQRLRSTTLPLFTTPGISDRSLYDWESVNFVAINYRKERADIKNVQIEQELFRNPTHHLAARAGWNEERFASYRVDFVGGLTAVLLVDVNERLLDGTPNPFFRRPYIGAAQPQVIDLPSYDDVQSADLAYQYAPRHLPRWLGWIGTQKLIAHGDTRRSYNDSNRYRDTVVSDHSWSNLQRRADGNLMNRVYFRYYVGDNQRQNVDYAPPALYGVSGRHDLKWFNGATSQWVTENANLQPAGIIQGTTRARSEVRTLSLASQNYFLSDRIVTTFAIRRDRQRGRDSSASQVDPTTGLLDYSGLRRFTNWVASAGDTKTAGIVARPTRWVSAFFNHADSFQTAGVQYTLLGELLPNPTGRGRDYGLMLNLLGGKLVLKANRFETSQRNARTGNAAIAGRVISFETGRSITTSGTTFGSENLESWATGVITQRLARQGATASAAQIKTEVAKFMQLPEGFLDNVVTKNIGATDDTTTKGIEFEANYNPAKNWTLKGNVAFQRAIDATRSPGIQQYLDWRMPVWTTVKDDDGISWWNSTGAASGFNTAVFAPYKLLVANAGKPRSQTREWRANGLTNYRFTDGKFKNLSLGGGVRWESKAAIGFYGAPPDSDGVIRSYDGNRPIYDRARYYIDLTAGYNLRLFTDRVRTRIQLNVQNVLEDGRLQVVGVNPDGQPFNFRIVDPRKFVLSTTFDL